MNHHIIYRQKATVTVAREADANAVQNEIGDVMKNDLPRLLQDVFDSIAPENSIVRIDSLQLDLGTLPVENIKQVFKERIAEKIKEAITVKKENAFYEDGVTVIRKEQSLREAFLYFLQYGNMPWFIHGKSRKAFESEIQQGFAKDDWQKTVSWLRQNINKHPVVVERLVHQFSDDFLEPVFINTVPFGEERWKDIYQDLLSLATNKKEGKTQFLSLCLYSFLQEKTLTDALYRIVKSITKSEDANGFNFIKKSGDAISTKTVAEVFEKLKHEKSPSIERYDENKVVQQQSSVVNTDEIPYDFSFLNNPSLTESKSFVTNQVEKEPQYVSNCGIVLLHPFLEMYFTEFDLLNKRKFISDDACKRAVLLLHYLATGEIEGEEWNLLLQKMICSLPFEETLPNRIEITDKEKAESERVLQSVINYCSPLKNTSLAGLRSTFLQRDGRLKKKDNSWLLTVEQKTVDVLLDKIPWGFSTIKFPWLADLINVDWC